MDYDILRADGERELINLVSERIKEGWEPIGSVAIAQQLCSAHNEYGDNRCTLYDAGFIFAQAMIRR